MIVQVRTLIAAVVAVSLAAAFTSCAVRQPADVVELHQSSAVRAGLWVHVATLHGWADDYAVCLEIAEFLESARTQYRCRNAE